MTAETGCGAGVVGLASPRSVRSTDDESVRARGVLILNGDVDGNLGDGAIFEATCQLLRERLGGVRLAVVSDRPELRRQRSGAMAVPRGVRGLPALCRAIRRSDIVLIGGGGLFQDDDSLIKMPYWALRAALVCILGRRVVGYALGVGPLKHLFSRMFARIAFACMDEISVRDEGAREVAQALTNKPVRVVPDPALVLAAAPTWRARAALSAAGVPLDGRPLVGVALRRWFPPRPRFIPHRITCRLGLPDPQDGDEGHELVRLLAQALDGVVQRHGAHIVFMPTYCTTEEGDDRLAAAVAEAMRAPRGSSIVMLDEPAHYKACCGMFNLLIGGRMHPAILAAAMGTPVIGLAYNPKFRGAFELLGTPDRWIDVEWFVRNRCVEPLNGLIDAAIDAGRLPSEPVASLVRRIQSFHQQLSSRLA